MLTNILTSSAMIEISFPSNNYAKIGFKTVTEVSNIPSYSLQAYNQNGTPIPALSGNLNQFDDDYSFNIAPTPIDRLRLTITRQSLSQTELYYFCAGL